MSNLDGKVFLITGGAGGIGQASAEALVAQGGKVVITDVSEDAGVAAVKDIQERIGGEVRFETLDVTDPDAVRELASKLEADGWPVHGLMANAGIAPTSAAVDYPDQLWRTTVDINLNGVFWTVREFGRRMVERGEGAVVITSSIAGFGVVSPETHVAYGSTKAAVAHMAKLLAVEWARDGVRVNAIAPGYTETPILEKLKEEDPSTFDEWLSRTPAGRLNTPQEIANGAVFLLSDLASGITGSTLHIDNGYSAR